MTSILKLQIKRDIKTLLFWFSFVCIVTFSFIEFGYVVNYPIISEENIMSLKDGHPEFLYIKKGKEELEQDVLDKLINIQEADYSQEFKAAIQNGLNFVGEEFTIEKMNSYIETYYPSYFCQYEIVVKNLEDKIGSKEEINDNIIDQCGEKTFSHYFANEFSDIMQTFMMIMCFVLFGFMFDTDKKVEKNIAMKDVNGINYVLGRFLGRFIWTLAILFSMMIILDALIWFNFHKAGMDISIVELPYYFILYIMPTVLFFSVLALIFNLIFKSGLTALPLYCVFMLMNATGGAFNINTPYLLPCIRIDDYFQNASYYVYLNRIIYILISIVLLRICGSLWERKNRRK